MPSIDLVNITNYALRNLNLRVMDGELLALLGPNGAGKTTLLNVIAGLTVYTGSVLFDGKPIDNTPPQERLIGYIFQKPLLFPHLDVESNISYSLRARGATERIIQARVEELLRTMGIRHLNHRYPATLSGGEQQRVALARALANNPKVLLLDEPFNSLDFNIQRQLRLELKHLHKSIRITTIFVTHDLAEAEEVADRIAVINEGEIRQVGYPNEVLFTPKDQTVFDFIGKPNVLNCERFIEVSQGLAEVRCGDISFIVLYEGKPIKKIAILPSDIHISLLEPEGSKVNCFKGVVENITPSNNSVRIDVKIEGVSLRSSMLRDECDALRINVGSEVFLKIRLKRIRTLEEDCNTISRRGGEQDCGV